MRVFRVEHKYHNVGPVNTGPYQEDCICAYLVAGTQPHHPLPQEEPSLTPFFDCTQYFGFECMEDVYNWFDVPDDRDFLDNEGYVIAEYEVDDTYVYIGQYQVMFDGAGVDRLVEQHEIETHFDRYSRMADSDLSPSVVDYIIR